MKVLIEVDDKDYADIMSDSERNLNHYERLIKKGIPLPKGHGRIGDLDVLKKDMLNYHDDCAKTSEYTRLGFETAIAVVENANQIIEADKAESEDKEWQEKNEKKQLSKCNEGNKHI